MTKEALLHELASNTFVMLKPSAIEGIGVFAMIDIPKGQTGIFSNDSSEWVKIHRNDINQLPPHSKHLVENHCLYDSDYYYVPEYGFKMIDLVIFINHSDEPNIVSLKEGMDFEAIRDIKAGEELLLDYGDIVDE